MRVLLKKKLDEIVGALKQGEVLVFPTETSYGLGCDATNQKAVDKIFEIKNRVKEKPLLVVVHSIAMAQKYLEWNEILENLASKYWFTYRNNSEGETGALTVVGKYRLNPPLLNNDLVEVDADKFTSYPLLFKEGQYDPTPNTTLKREEDDKLLSDRSHPPLFKEGLGEVEKRIIANQNTLSFRQKLRKVSTTAEKILWKELKGKKLGGLKFRRQHGIGPYIVDFYESKFQTIIELDGDVHFSIEKQEKNDKIREKYFKDNGYKIIRFNNVDVFNNLDGVLDHLYYNLTSPNPLLKKRGHDDITSPNPLLKKRGLDSVACSSEKRAVDNMACFSEKRGLNSVDLAKGVVSNNSTLALRVTKDPWLQKLCQKFGRPIVATSANLAGEENIYDFVELKKIFTSQKHQPDVIIDGGILEKKPTSTLVSVLDNKIKILRQGELKINI